WWEYYDGGAGDSTGFSPFWFIAILGSDSTLDTMSVKWNADEIEMELLATAGQAATTQLQDVYLRNVRIK
ncbi:unnamed protein product, partial [marine sediment metagenome]